MKQKKIEFEFQSKKYTALKLLFDFPEKFNNDPLLIKLTHFEKTESNNKLLIPLGNLKTKKSTLKLKKRSFFL